MHCSAGDGSFVRLPAACTSGTNNPHDRRQTQTASLGLYAIQLARVSNLRVIATASPKNFDLVRSHGAAVVLDYRDPEVIAKIVTATQSGGVDYVLDAISEDGTVRLSSKALRANGPKKSVVVLPVPSEELDPSVEYHFVFMATLLGKEVQLLDTYFPVKVAHAAPNLGRISMLSSRTGSRMAVLR